MTRRVEAERRGRLAESAAALWLAMKGYRLLARRFETPVGEIDLIAWQRQPKPHGTVCFIEVKWRPTLSAASEAIAPRQRARLERAGALFLQRRPALAAADVRFDAMLMAPGQWPRHLRNAWQD